MAELNLKPKNNIKILSGIMPFEKLVELYNQADVFVNASMAEAFNMSCIQAMACGLPVLSTNFGGMTDYINEENGWLIGGSMIAVDWDTMYEGVKWQLPNIAELRRKMRYVFEHRDEAKAKGIKALETAKEWTWKNSAEIAIKELNTIAIKNLEELK
jgi:glycosyltransferase involved in cell wall biosynthesis